MTIHKAKGLEWDFVIVPGLEKKGASNQSELLNWIEFESGDASRILLAPIAGKGQQATSIYKWLNNLRSARDAEERKRVFYVACTRAREELHLFAALDTKTDGSLYSPLEGSLLKACYPAAQPSFAEALHRSDSVADTLRDALHFLEDLTTGPESDSAPLSLAASAEEPSKAVHPPYLHRLPLSFDPRARFKTPAMLSYVPAASLTQVSAFERPEGSFAARAFGNVVHRFLELFAQRLAGGASLEALTADVASWQPRLAASLRSEGLAPAQAERESNRVLQALNRTLADPIGQWLLKPHPLAASESSLTTPERTLRADRTFLAGPTPLSSGDSTLWIVDFKTTEQGTRTNEAFRELELAKYRAQMDSYAALRQTADPVHAVRLALYYPLLPTLLTW
jgi:ATP-dependent exoDNAse (exonuclease V) beta subunit